MRLSAHIEINRSPEDVFPWLSDPERAMKWMTSVTAGEILHATPERIGTTFRERVEENGRGTELTGVITGFVQNELISFHLEGNYNAVDVDYRVRPLNGHSRVSYTADVRFKSSMRVAMLVVGPLFRRKIRAQTASELASLKRMCERADYTDHDE